METQTKELTAAETLAEQIAQHAAATEEGAPADIRHFVLERGTTVFPEAFVQLGRGKRLTPEGRDQIVAAVTARQDEFGSKYDNVLEQLAGFRLQPSEYDGPN